MEKLSSLPPGSRRSRRLLPLLLVVLVGLLAAPAADASRYVPSPIAAAATPPRLPELEVASGAGPAQVSAYALFTAEDLSSLAAYSLLDSSEAERLPPLGRYRLFERESSIPRPVEHAVISKLASGLPTWVAGDNVKRWRYLGPESHRVTFQGLWTDPVTGLSYARNRWLDTRNGVWLSEDPRGAVDSTNLYAGFGWMPHAVTDPFGLQLAPGDDYDTWRAANPDASFSAYTEWVDRRRDAQRPDSEEEGWLTRKWRSLRDWYGESRFSRYPQAVQGATQAQDEHARLRASYTDVESDESLSLHLDGRQTGIGAVSGAYTEVVVAGVVTVVVVLDDASLVMGAGAIAKYGLREGMQLLVRKADGAEQLFRVVDGKLVRQSTDLHHTIPRQVRKSRRTGLSMLPDHLVEHPDIRGRAGNPNRWPVPRSEHLGKGGIHYREEDYNRRFIEELDSLEEVIPDRSQWTVEEIVEIRDRLAAEFDIERYRPSR